MNIKIVEVIGPSDKQKAAGILGSVNLAITDDNDVQVVYLRGIGIRSTKDGKSRFLSPPSYKMTRDGQDKYVPHFKIFPFGEDETLNKTQRDRMNQLTDDVLRALDKGHTRSAGDNPTASTPAAPQPAPQAAPAGATEPWSHTL